MISWERKLALSDSMKNDIHRSRYAEPPQVDEAGLIAYLRTQPDVAAAYLFGSMATGRATPQSDVDIAVLLVRVPGDPGSALDRQLELTDELRRFTDREADVVILNRAPILLRRQVLAYGQLLYQGDREVRVNFEVQTGKEYADLKPMYDFFKEVLFDEIEEVGLGRRRRRPFRTTQLSQE